MATARRALAAHWREYLCEAWGLGLFMLSACAFAALLEHPASPARAALRDAVVRRALMGAAMAATALVIVYSPSGRRSGAHINPAMTLTFLRLGKIAPWDAAFYVAAQFGGGLAGTLLAGRLLDPWVADPAIGFAATVPGPGGAGIAFVAELGISFGMMAVVLLVSNRLRIAPYTGVCCAVLVATYITLEAPLSGMSMNPARTVASAVPAQRWTAAWVYFVAPAAGMLLAAECYVRVAGARRVHCAKLNHTHAVPCIFRCGW